MRPLRPEGISKVLGAILIEKSCRNKIQYLIVDLDGSNLQLVDALDEFGVCTSMPINEATLSVVNSFLKSKEFRPEGIVRNNIYTYSYRVYKKGLKSLPDVHQPGYKQWLGKNPLEV
jgi:hypothetical protein